MVARTLSQAVAFHPGALAFALLLHLLFAAALFANFKTGLLRPPVPLAASITVPAEMVGLQDFEALTKNRTDPIAAAPHDMLMTENAAPAVLKAADTATLSMSAQTIPQPAIRHLAYNNIIWPPPRAAIAPAKQPGRESQNLQQSRLFFFISIGDERESGDTVIQFGVEDAMHLRKRAADGDAPFVFAVLD